MVTLGVRHKQHGDLSGPHARFRSGPVLGCGVTRSTRLVTAPGSHAATYFDSTLTAFKNFGFPFSICTTLAVCRLSPFGVNEYFPRTPT